MHFTSTKFLVLGFLLTMKIDCTKCAAIASDPIIDSKSESAERAKNEGFPSLIKSETKFDSSNSPSPTETVIDLGTQLCNTEVRIQWTIANKSKHAIDWPRMTASCGCISGVPTSLALAVDESTQMEFTIQLPRHSETLTKQITFWDANGNGRCQGIVKADVVTPLKIEAPLIDVKDEKKHWASLEVTASNKSIDLRKQTVIAIGPEVVSCELKSEDGQKGLVRIELDPSKTFPPSIQSTFTLEITRNGAFQGTTTLPMRFTSRTITQPEPVYFRLVGKEYQAQVRVWSFPLAAELSKKSEFVVEASYDSSEKFNSTFETKIEPLTGKGPTCTVTLKHLATSAGNTRHPNQLRLKCGEWERKIACKWE